MAARVQNEMCFFFHDITPAHSVTGEGRLDWSRRLFLEAFILIEKYKNIKIAVRLQIY